MGNIKTGTVSLLIYDYCGKHLLYAGALGARGSTSYPYKKITLITSSTTGQKDIRIDEYNTSGNRDQGIGGRVLDEDILIRGGSYAANSTTLISYSNILHAASYAFHSETAYSKYDITGQGQSGVDLRVELKSVDDHNSGFIMPNDSIELTVVMSHRDLPDAVPLYSITISACLTADGTDCTSLVTTSSGDKNFAELWTGSCELKFSWTNSTSNPIRFDGFRMKANHNDTHFAKYGIVEDISFSDSSTASFFNISYPFYNRGAIKIKQYDRVVVYAKTSFTGGLRICDNSFSTDFFNNISGSTTYYAGDKICEFISSNSSDKILTMYLKSSTLSSSNVPTIEVIIDRRYSSTTTSSLSFAGNYSNASIRGLATRAYSLANSVTHTYDTNTDLDDLILYEAITPSSVGSNIFLSTSGSAVADTFMEDTYESSDICFHYDKDWCGNMINTKGQFRESSSTVTNALKYTESSKEMQLKYMIEGLHPIGSVEVGGSLKFTLNNTSPSALFLLHVPTTKTVSIRIARETGATSGAALGLECCAENLMTSTYYSLGSTYPYTGSLSMSAGYYWVYITTHNATASSRKPKADWTGSSTYTTATSGTYIYSIS